MGFLWLNLKKLQKEKDEKSLNDNNWFYFILTFKNFCKKIIRFFINKKTYDFCKKIIRFFINEKVIDCFSVKIMSYDIDRRFFFFWKFLRIKNWKNKRS